MLYDYSFFLLLYYYIIIYLDLQNKNLKKF